MLNIIRNNEVTPYGYIYKITNKLTGEIYIGKHILKNEPWRKYMGSSESLNIAIKMFGKDHFIKTLEAYEYSQEKLSKLELKIMNEYKKSGYAMYNKNFSSPAFTSRGILDLDEVRRKEIWEQNSSNLINKNLKKYNKIFSEIGNEIIEFYESEQHLKKTAKNFGLPVSRIRDFLLKNNVELNSQNSKGRKLSQEKKKSISEGLKKYNLNNPKNTKENYNKAIYKKKNNKNVKKEININGEELRELYINKNKTLKELAQHFKCSTVSIKTALKEFNIPTRTKDQNPSYKTKKISRDELYNLYVNKDYTIGMLCTHFNCGKSSIYGLLQRYSIPTRSLPNTCKLYKESIDESSTIDENSLGNLSEDVESEDLLNSPLDGDGNYSLF